MKLEDVKRLAELARIDISDSEAKELLKDMGSILSYVGDIKEAVATEVPSDERTLRNVMREDGEPHEPEAYSKKILSEAPKTEKEYVKVKQILS